MYKPQHVCICLIFCVSCLSQIYLSFFTRNTTPAVLQLFDGLHRKKKDIVRGFLIFYGYVNTCIFVHLTWHCQSTSCQCALLRPVTSLVLTEKLHSF